VGYPDLALKLLFLRYPIPRVLRASSIALLLLAASLMMSQSPKPSQCKPSSAEIVVTHIPRDIQVNAHRPAREWESAAPIAFCADWQGQNPDPGRQTEVKALWSDKTLYLRFQCHYRELNTFTDSDANGRRDHLWDKDVAEAFLQPDPSRQRYYKEFEVAPNGMWIDLDISPGPLQDLKSGLLRSVSLDEKTHRWNAELAIPLSALTAQFDPQKVWRANFYRVEGKDEPRSYMAWQPTNTPQPNFHVPPAFGTLRFQP
jgi:cellulose/xylan binding protein with CBM9 domain